MEVYIYQVFLRLNFRLREVLCTQKSSEIRQRGQGKELGEKFLPHCAVSLLRILPAPVTIISQVNTLQTFPGFCSSLKNINCSDHQTVKQFSVQFSCSVVSNSLQPHELQTPGLPLHHQLPEFTETHVHQVGDAIQPSHPLSSPSPPALNPSSIRMFSNESTLRMRWPKYWSFSFSTSPSSEYSGLVSFRID